MAHFDARPERLKWLKHPPCHRQVFSLLLATLFALATAIPASAIGPAGSTWKPRELVDSGLDFLDHLGVDRALAFDHFGKPAVAYHNSSDAYFGSNVPGIGWAGQDINFSGGAGGRGRYISLGFDRHERPGMSYINIDEATDDAGLNFTYFDGQLWSTQTVDSSVGVDSGLWSSLAYDRLGNPAIAYYDTGSGVKFAYDNDGDLDFSNNGFNFVNAVQASHLSLAFDHLNRPMMSYVTSSGDLVFAVKEAQSWLTTTLDTGSVGSKSTSSLAIDPDTGYPTIAYEYGSVPTSLKVAEWNGSTWDYTTVDAIGSTGQMPSIAFDPTDGNAAIAYYSADGSDLRIAWDDGTQWQNSLVDGVGTVGLNPSIAFREFGTGDKVAAISYYDLAGNLWYIEDPPVVVPEPASLTALLASGVLLSRRRRSTTMQRG